MLPEFLYKSSEQLPDQISRRNKALAFRREDWIRPLFELHPYDPQPISSFSTVIVIQFCVGYSSQADTIADGLALGVFEPSDGDL